MKELSDMMKKILTALFCICWIVPTEGQPLRRVVPEQVGLSTPTLKKADKVIEEAIQKGRAPGAVFAVVRHGKMAYIKAYGNRQVYPSTLPMTTNTVFDMASCSKSMSTAMSTMKLLEQGVIRLDDKVSKYIPGFRDWSKNDKTRPIRIIDLLTHNSGLPSYANYKTVESLYGSTSPEILMDYIATCNRISEPETKFTYSCLNFITLQHIIENTTGKSLRDFSAENIFEPLGMHHTDYIPCRQQADGNWTSIDQPRWIKEGEPDGISPIAPTERQPNGQVLQGQVHDPLARVCNWGISGNAGLFSTADDIAILCAALLNGGEWNNHRVLSPETVVKMRTVPKDLIKFGRSLGWDVNSAYAPFFKGDLSSKTFSHTGYTGTSITIDPDNDLAIILLTNDVHPVDSTNVVRLRRDVAHIVSMSITNKPTDYTQHYYDRIVEFEKDKPIDNQSIVMLGNSLTENGGDWAERLNNRHVVNRGIIGDVVEGVNARLYQIMAGRPEKVFYLIGVNDVSHDLSADSIVSMIKASVKKMRKESPQTQIYLQSLLPIREATGRWKRLVGKTNLIPTINGELANFAKEEGIEFINLFPLFTENGNNVLRKELTTDGLHLTQEGYQIWTNKLREYIKGGFY